MRYPRLLARHGLSEEEIEEHIGFLRRISELVDVVIGEPVVLSDPDDDPVIYTALEGGADVLCTLDRISSSGASPSFAAHGISRW